MSVLEAINVTKTFQEGRTRVEVLRHVSVSIERGEAVILEGPSGSGKTTLLSILGCILTPTTGRVMVDDVEVDPKDPDSLAAVRRKSLGFVFQQFNLFPALTAVENVEYAINVKGERGEAARREAEELIRAVGLSDRRMFLPRDLSGGQKQRVAIARALAKDPAVVLADEPTANLDSDMGHTILTLFRDLARRRNKGLLIVTHDPKVRTIADRILRISDGRIIDP